MREFCDKFYSLVPKDYKANLKWRREVIEMCRHDETARAEFWDMCSRDILFYINTFLFTLNSRELNEPVIPFITYDYQDRFFSDVWGLFGKEDIAVEKSRDMGATWMWLIMIEWHWHFVPWLAFLLISQKEEMVYKKGNEKALFSKIEFLHRFQPPWLLPTVDDRELHKGNLDNNSSIDGESTTKTSSTGDRRSVIFCDEFSKLDVNDGYKILQSTRAVTQCRIFNSTHFGINNAFYDLTRGDNKFKNVLRLGWWERPEFGKGLYRVKGGKVEIIDTDYDFGDYDFVLEEPSNEYGYRSPWYDYEASERVLSKHEMAEEVDMNPVGGVFQFFDEVVNKCLPDCRPPIRKGNIILKDKAVFERWEDVEDGICKLWCEIDERTGRPLPGDYVLGIDISAGTGASNSAISVGNVKTGEKIAEIVSSDLLPYQWAYLAVAVAEWFNDAKMCWEANGPTGREFGITVRDLGYGNVYYRENKDTGKQTANPGWLSDKDTKPMLLGEYRQALFNKTFKNYSKYALNECLEYIRETNGDLVHRSSKNLIDPTGAGASHGDRVIADALCNWVMRSSINFTENVEPDIPVNSLAWRLNEQRKAERQKANLSSEWVADVNYRDYL